MPHRRSRRRSVRRNRSSAAKHQSAKPDPDTIAGGRVCLEAKKLENFSHTGCLAGRHVLPRAAARFGEHELLDLAASLNIPASGHRPADYVSPHSE